MLDSELFFETPEPSSNSDQKDFDYEALDAETRIVVQQRTTEIKSLMRKTAHDTIEIGQKLIEVKDQLEHGNFRKWLKAEFSWGVTTAWKLMKVAEAFKSSHCENLKIAASALYLLAAPSTPCQLRQEALERAIAGETITHSKAKAIVSQHGELKPDTDKSVTFDVLVETMEFEPTTVTTPEPVEIAQKTQPFLELRDESGGADEDEREQVCIKTSRPELRQWNDRIGFVVARDYGSVYVKFGDYTLSFLESEVQPIAEQSNVDQEEAEILNGSEQQVLPVTQLQLELPQNLVELGANEDECSRTTQTEVSAPKTELCKQTPTALINWAAVTQGIPEGEKAEIAEIAFVIQRLAREQLAFVISGLSDSQLEFVIEVAQQTLNSRLCSTA